MVLRPPRVALLPSGAPRAPELALHKFTDEAVDVFKTVRSGGNQLAVVSDARGLSDAEMPGWIEKAVSAVPGVSGVSVRMTFDPPWDKSHLSDEARVTLDMC